MSERLTFTWRCERCGKAGMDEIVGLVRFEFFFERHFSQGATFFASSPAASACSESCTPLMSS